MLSAKMDLFGGVAWQASGGSAIRVPTRTEAQDTVLHALLETPLREQHRNPLDWLVSLLVHAVVLAALIVAPLLFTQVIDVHDLQLTYLVTPSPPAPPSPPPAAPAVQKLAPRKVAPLVPSRLVAPSVIPRQIAMLHEPPAAPDMSGGVIGGIPGGATGGVLGGIIGGTPMPPPVAAPVQEKKAKEILRPGGNVKLPQKIYAPPPMYPALAKAAHVQGTVLIDAVIDEQGNIVNAKVVEGPALLVPEAMRTVMLWKYEPTYLNGVPYPIRMTITMNFSFAS
jgi:periplasmic protein TonB